MRRRERRASLLWHVGGTCEEGRRRGGRRTRRRGRRGDNGRLVDSAHVTTNAEEINLDILGALVANEQARPGASHTLVIRRVEEARVCELGKEEGPVHGPLQSLVGIKRNANRL
jgi:hypothetical protein